MSKMLLLAASEVPARVRLNQIIHISPHHRHVSESQTATEHTKSTSIAIRLGEFSTIIRVVCPLNRGHLAPNP